MDKSIFNTKTQQENLSNKIVVGLERISEAFKALLWEQAKVLGLSPIQIQILIFIAYHKQELCNVSHLAKEFNVTKPTVSDAIKVLEKKGFIKKVPSSTDSRSYSISLSVHGKKIVKKTNSFANPIKNEVDKIKNADLEILYNSLNKLIYNLNKVGILNVQRTCYACIFYEKKDKQHFCNFLEKPLANKEIRIDCPEFDERLVGSNT
ncbi:helix-turn-helix domain-containing protein [Aureibaculum sp. 2210JD6-5]|uniref:MarR family winged helix-turn-helix transcriptional regulator n=1 Tax=Aureibaculum sp. 2210JD6-5 TaxID=3103957 RepID=UPI002AAD4DCA|nr:helix-turn-helix domain-containing protein [Aureibaculum sp. 2210JD6-5]MDY7395232.1 helix-turn-helix domain-containing protein [Aureibaculum sp. 2210JD6-5]